MENIKNYVDESENEKIYQKVTKLTNLVKKLSNENNSLRAKVNNLENIIEKICSQLKIQSNLSSNANETSHKNDKTASQEEVEETWLYYIKKGVSKEKVTAKLSLTSDPLVIELSVTEWINENKLLIDLLNSFPKFKEFSEDWSSMDNKQLRHFLQTILASTLINDTVLILRNLPGKQNKLYDSIMSNIATVAEIMYSTWEELEVNNELMGNMALILESEEELQILNIVKNNSRLILFVEPLF